MREPAQELRYQDMTANNCAIGLSIQDYGKLKIPKAKFEEFLNTIFEFSQEMDINQEILRDALKEFIILIVI